MCLHPLRRTKGAPSIFYGSAIFAFNCLSNGGNSIVDQAGIVSSGEKLHPRWFRNGLDDRGIATPLLDASHFESQIPSVDSRTSHKEVILKDGQPESESSPTKYSRQPFTLISGTLVSTGTTSFLAKISWRLELLTATLSLLEPASLVGFLPT